MGFNPYRSERISWSHYLDNLRTWYNALYRELRERSRIAVELSSDQHKPSWEQISVNSCADYPITRTKTGAPRGKTTDETDWSIYWRNEVTTVINRLREVEPKYTFQEERHAMVNSHDMYDTVTNYPETHVLTESNVLSPPIGGKTGGEVTEPPSQLSPPERVEGDNLLLPALNNKDDVIHESSLHSYQDNNRRTPKPVSPDGQPSDEPPCLSQTARQL